MTADIMDAEPDADLFISTDCISHEVHAILSCPCNALSPTLTLMVGCMQTLQQAT